MSVNGSCEGLQAELQAMAVGDIISRAVRCDPSDAATPFRTFSQRVSAYIAKRTDRGAFTTVTVDGLVRDGTAAIRCVVIERIA